MYYANKINAWENKYPDENKEVYNYVGASNVFEDNTDSKMGAPVSGYTGPAVNGLEIEKEIPEVNPKELLPKGGGMFDNLALAAQI